MAEFTANQVMGVTFEITSRFISRAVLGNMNSSAKDQILQKLVAVRKVTKPFGSSVLSKQALREIKLLRYLQHENLVSMSDLFISPAEDLYIVSELMWTNLQRLINGKGAIEDGFSKYFLYQILRGLKYVHSAGIIHRDLKPSSILINDNCDLKISGFGNARLQGPQMTGYVATRFYRAPEIMLTWQKYSAKVDIWSVGCIFAEMLCGRPIFPASSHADQFHQIVDLLGSPPIWIVDTISNNHTKNFVESLPKCKRKPLREVFPNIDPSAADLLERMLVFDVNERINARDALSQPYLAPYHDPNDEPVMNDEFDWSFDSDSETPDTIKSMELTESRFLEVWAFRTQEREHMIERSGANAYQTPVSSRTNSDTDLHVRLETNDDRDDYDKLMSTFCQNFECGN
ncbi:mitogen-activated protein kinase Hog1 [Penicillium taxi]|uniref:mitogen-activated protein kinase Hog1 n=1 Tax=Penicillium taxi TaxID=168475 RepID=UPI00254582E3|nr:mitogen-activated protein kinase Hog1 [Penicillium taxi]KAJ5902216.1 mitogen-activated protein kinase Hog1 [Penicillium taxi]